MNIKPIHSEADYQGTLTEIEALWDAGDGSEAAEKLEVLSLLIETYEKKHFPIEAPDPVDFLQYIMETRGLTRKDMEPYIGPRGRVSDILNRVRPMSLEMIRRLSVGLGLPATVLIQDYPLKQEVA
ncbi:transcription regulator with HTH domain (plasmid) [Sulfuricella denitrificans skB26]|uniref:Transcription regulator with HTH domain n=1 Tax=Sulfuricella denitrificans (strain DSM 22764 / NBRC 105220 / skB26) TaxID=1163617 RepID=S6AKD2_SULDS|nr:transcriptional regulator [Sulfuricella denitrificans]BAN36861.1 transcription regulator with HTH domain [Sulfuricella denitrificans skB26]